VRKHLENVYAKLGVHTRTAAASFVRELKEPSA
jgi:DNA-binding CsgD family transcriptional regulator